MSRLSGSAGNCLWPVKTLPSAWGSLSCQEKSVANLDHILRCLRQAALERLVYYGLESLEADILHWRQYWQQQKHLNHGWFSEWPNGRRPLSTTWPWNIRPSLVVLWGVCWMFYDNNTGSSRNLSQEFEGQNSGSFWPRPAPQSATPNQRKRIHHPLTAWFR